ncbi:failed axon connections homolog [Saccoglossus kowalevskii]|uniref:Failed axon connections homolog n=1 Tax=Saccoglossus kowalevskii TaxID=10224 RepID=A0ABM0GXF3_SACKO|nr:PREDICTED: failed axon connections homolog [Saccoglossus kowalevskii]
MAAEQGNSTPSKTTEIPEKGKLVLHQFAPQKDIPSHSAFCLKLETYLRMSDVPYENRYGMKRSAKGKLPWIEYKGQEIPDSSFCIDFINKEFEVDLNKDLSDVNKGAAKAFQRLAEENCYWTINYHRYIVTSDEYFKNSFPTAFRWFLVKMVRKNVRNNLHAHGIGRHSKDEIYRIAQDDLKAISQYLGEKTYFFGDSPTTVDATLFGILAQIVWAMPGSPHEKFATEECTNLKPYCERIKEKYYPDWDELLAKTKGSKADAAPAEETKEEEKKDEVEGETKEEEAEEDKKDGDDGDKAANGEAGGDENAADEKPDGESGDKGGGEGEAKE